MRSYRTQSPVVMLAYNRPQKTALVFNEISRVKPRQLFLVADGPKENQKDEERCAETRKILEHVDWPCEVVKVFSEVNLGCKRRVSSGIDAVFREVDRAIIVEDDCLPGEGFFSFCDEMLARYSDNDEVGHVNGTNLRGGDPVASHDYYFSRYPHVWGWATWRRAWNLYDVSLKEWSDDSGRQLLRRFCDQQRSADFWHKIFHAVSNQKIDTWDYQWVFALWRNSLLSVTPNRNLIRNIGFDNEATHTKKASPLFDLPVSNETTASLRHPPVQRDAIADAIVEKLFYTAPTLRERIIRKIKERFLS